MRYLAVLASLCPALAAAETPMTGAEFQAHVGNRTVTYAYSDGSSGTADYGPGQTLLWAFAGDSCFNGSWHQQADQLCFAFENGQLSACWHFFKDGDSIRGVSTFLHSGSPETIEIRETGQTDQPLACPGPDVGV